MLGFLVLGLTSFMIFTLVKNALTGTQLRSDETYMGTVELIIPITHRSEFYLEPWLKSLHSFRSLQGRLKIHLLIDGHHPAMTAWEELQHKLPFVELHSFAMRPESSQPVPWMIQQISAQVSSPVVIIGDAELVADEAAFIALARLVSEKKKPYFVLPQTNKRKLLGESVAVLNPTLSLASVFGFRKYRRNISHPLISIAQGWIGMPLESFKALETGKSSLPSWKQAIVRQWEREKIDYDLAFGEKYLTRYYPEELSLQIQQMKIYWEELWLNGDRKGLWLFAASLFIWSFPIICFSSHPFWSIASMILLVIYRFFSKVVFQESWGTILLHPIGCIVWLGTFIWWAASGLKSRYGTQGPEVKS